MDEVGDSADSRVLILEFAVPSISEALFPAQAVGLSVSVSVGVSVAFFPKKALGMSVGVSTLE